MTGPAARTVTFVRDHGVGVGRELLFNFVLPYLIYSYGEAPWGQVHALMASSAPPLVWTLIEFARHRRIDAVSLLVLAGIGLSLLAFLGGGGAGGCPSASRTGHAQGRRCVSAWRGTGGGTAAGRWPRSPGRPVRSQR